MASLGAEGTPLRFLNFPKEIRDKIYNELLLAEKIFSKSSNKYRFRLNILKVNSKITTEAYEVLYKANQWINVQEEGRSLKQSLVQLCIPFIPLTSSRCFYHDPAMALKLRCPATPTMTPKKRFEWSYLVTADRLEDVCLALSIANEKAAVYARISFSFRKRCLDNRPLQDKLSHCLPYLPRFKQTDVTGLNPAPLRWSIIHDLTTTPPWKLTDSETALKSYELEGDLCYRATTARGAKAKDNLSVNSKLATKRYNRAFAGTLTLLAQASSAAPLSFDGDPSITSTIINHRLLPLVCKLTDTAAGYRVKDDEGLTTLHLLIALFRAHHLPSNVYALLQAQDHLPDDWQELKKPAVRLWKSIVKRAGHKHRMAHLALLQRRFADTFSKLEVPGDLQEQMLEGDKNAEV
ncbi:MAG: hypothetical protein L6R42_008867 [Xanthoria sp. 1 TBL-2021]|nr:MAG: hypothetical protein L6R42_008867 [Xanthoria sp. 1 TBL-2021]